MKATDVEKPSQDSFYVKEKNRLIKIKLHEVIAFESQLHSIIIHTLHTKTSVQFTMEKIKAMLVNNNDFIRVHRSFIISERHIEQIDGNVIILANQMKISLGRLYKKEFANMINTKILNDNI